jgi:hypothetical protein
LVASPQESTAYRSENDTDDKESRKDAFGGKEWLPCLESLLLECRVWNLKSNVTQFRVDKERRRMLSARPKTARRGFGGQLHNIHSRSRNKAKHKRSKKDRKKRLTRWPAQETCLLGLFIGGGRRLFWSLVALEKTHRGWLDVQVFGAGAKREGRRDGHGWRLD